MIYQFNKIYILNKQLNIYNKLDIIYMKLIYLGHLNNNKYKYYYKMD